MNSTDARLRAAGLALFPFLAVLAACRPGEVRALEGLWSGSVTCDEDSPTELTLSLAQSCRFFTCTSFEADMSRDGLVRSESGAEFRVHHSLRGDATLDGGTLDLRVSPEGDCVPELLRDGDETFSCEALADDDVAAACDGAWEWDGGDTLTLSDDGCEGELTFCEDCGRP